MVQKMRCCTAIVLGQMVALRSKKGIEKEAEGKKDAQRKVGSTRWTSPTCNNFKASKGQSSPGKTHLGDICFSEGFVEGIVMHPAGDCFALHRVCKPLFPNRGSRLPAEQGSNEDKKR